MGSTNTTRHHQHTNKQQHLRPTPLYQNQDGRQDRRSTNNNRADVSLPGDSGGSRRDRRFLSQGVTTGLMYACQQGDVEAVRRIIREQPYQLTLRDRSNKSPLHYCCQSLLRRGAAAQTADLLVMAAPHLIDGRDEDGFTPLHLAVIAGNIQLITFLLANRADVNAVDNESHTVVHWATVCGEIGALRAVLAAGAPVSTPDVHGGYPLHYAAQMCGADKDRQLNLSILQTLLTQPDINTTITDGDGRQPLLWAASAGGAQAVLALVKAGAPLEAPDRDGLTALHCSASRGHTEVMDTLLTLCGAQVDVIDINGCTALHYAVTLGHADATALLLAHGANPNRQDRKGRSPAHCGCAKGQSETVRMLAGIGAANMWLRNARGDLPLHEAAASGRRSLVRWLLEARPSYVNARNNDGRCPLHLAAINDNADMCKVLLDSGAHINPLLRTSKNIVMTPLDCALQRGYRTTAKYLQVHGGLSAKKIDSNQANSQINIKIIENNEEAAENSSESEEAAMVRGGKEKVKKRGKSKTREKQFLEKVSPTLVDEIKEENVDQLNASSAKAQKPKIYEVNITKTTTENSDKSISKDTKVTIKKDSPRKSKSKNKKSKDLSNRKTPKDDSQQQNKLKSMEIEIKQTTSAISNEIVPKKQKNSLENSGSIKSTKRITVDDTKLEIIDTLAQNIEHNAKSIQKEVQLINISQNKMNQGDADKTDRSTDSSKIDDSQQTQNNQYVVEASVHPSPKTDSKLQEADILQSVKSLLEKEIKETIQQFKIDSKKIEEGEKSEVDYNKIVMNLIGELNDVKNQIETMKKNMESEKNVVSVEKEVKVVEVNEKSFLKSDQKLEQLQETVAKDDDELKSKLEDQETSTILNEIKDVNDEIKQIIVDAEVVTNDIEIADELLLQNQENLTQVTPKDTEVDVLKTEGTIIIENVLQNDPETEEKLPESTTILPEPSSQSKLFLKEASSQKPQRDSSIEPNSTDEEVQVEEEDTSSISAATTRERKQQHKSFMVIGPTQQQQQELGGAHAPSEKMRSRSEEVRLMEKRRSKIPTPIIGHLERRELSKSERDVRRMKGDKDGMRKKMPSLPNLSQRGNGRDGSHYSDDDRHSISDLEDTFPPERSSSRNSRTKRLMKRRSRSRTSKSAASLRQDGGQQDGVHSDYESSNIVDSGFEPSPRSVGRALGQRQRVVSDRGVNMLTVTQSIQSNIRRYHLERKIFQQLLDLKRLQIRSGQHNEHMLVKRSIDHYHRSCAATVGAGRYNSNDYSFKAFEKFLYQSLRKLQLQANNVDFIKDLPVNIPDNPLHCTQSTHRCSHATHAYTGIPCAAYLPKLDHHTIPKIGFDTDCKPSSGFLPHISKKSDDGKGVFLELRHGADKQVISLPTDRLDQNKRYYVTFTVKGQSEEEGEGKPREVREGESHRHAKSV